ncbi:MAG: hypothetical protein KatS3mg057_1657 [Herpetosiphonaceae bacterium]|nr:MAG: hypothetical protein KatS3mg057_1657 [Herpetosiphonaceae bacterium]
MNQDLVADRAPYTPPLSPSLEVELEIPREELAKLPGSDPLVLPPHTSAVVTVTTDSETLSQLYFQAINRVRKDQGLAPLAWDSDLAARAQGYAATRLWYWAMDEQGTVWKSRDTQIRHYFGIQHPAYASIGVSSRLASTSLLETTPDAARVLEIVQGAGYGATSDPGAKFVGVSVVMLTNATAEVPVGWLVIMYQ